MFRNILLVTFRTLRKNPSYTFINLAGLTLGISAFILVNAHLHFEKSFDRFHSGQEKIYRVESRFYTGEEMTDDWAGSSNGYAPAMKSRFPDIESYTRISWHDADRVLRNGNIKYRENHVCFADSNFLSFFTFPLLSGNINTALREPNSIVLTSRTARKYFGTSDPMGRILEVNTQGSSYQCKVTGVILDPPANSTLQFEMLLSWTTMAPFAREFWYQHESYSYVRLKPGAGPARIEAGFPALAEEYKTGPSLKALRWAVHLVPLAEIHLNPAKPTEIETKGNRRAVGFLSIIAYIILAIACLNYINLSLTKALDRAREVGIRKVSGATLLQVAAQFLFESFFLYGLAVLLSLGVTALLTGTHAAGLSELTGDAFLFDRALWIQTAAGITAGILLSGIYPAIVLARMQPIKILKGRYAFSPGGVILRKAMVAFQFGISLLLIAVTFGVYRQIDFMRRQPTGINVKQTLVIHAPARSEKFAEKILALKNEWRNEAGVLSVTVSGSVPGKAVGEQLANRKYGAPKTDERLYEMQRADADYIPAYGLKLLAGRGFDRSRQIDSTKLVLNLAAVRAFGYPSPEAAVGQKIWLETVESHPDEIIGVVDNYHQQSLQKAFTPVILFMEPALNWIPTDYISIRLNPAAGDLLPRFQKSWNNYFPESSFDFFFLDNFYDQQYRQDKQFGKSFLLFSGLAVLIASMGLFGLKLYSTTRRSREIGLRKVLGASATQVMALITWDMLKPILLSALFVLPVGYFVIADWLKGYAFRVEMSGGQFLWPLSLLLLVALFTTAGLTGKAAMSSPARTLREE